MDRISPCYVSKHVYNATEKYPGGISLKYFKIKKENKHKWVHGSFHLACGAFLKYSCVQCIKNQEHFK